MTYKSTQISQLLNYQFRCSFRQFVHQPFHIYIIKRVSLNSNNKKPNKNIRFQKILLFYMTYPSVVLRKGTINIDQGCVDSISKGFIYFSIIETQAKIGQVQKIFDEQNILPIINTLQRDLTSNRNDHENGAIFDVFVNF